MRRLALALLISLLAPLTAAAKEQINAYQVAIDVAADGDILVTETIDVTAEGNQIRRGIFRDLPRFYLSDGARLPFRYDVISIKRDGRKEPFDTSRENNAVRWRIGDADVLLPHGRHVYEIVYEVKNQIRHFESHDELYWNAIGQYWAFPIERARVVVALPDGAAVTSVSAYTGGYGERGGAYRYAVDGDDHVFTASRPFRSREGLTISLSLEKGVIDPPSAADKRADWWTLNGALVVLGGGLIGLFGFYGAAFNTVGRDPLKGPVFPRYEPPEGFSPAGVHHVYHRRLAGHQALISSLINLAVNDHLRIETPEKKKTKLTRLASADAKQEPFPIERELLRDLLAEGSSRTLGGKVDTTFVKAYGDFRKFATKKFGAPYFKWNGGYLAVAFALSIVIVLIAAQFSAQWSIWHFAALGALFSVNLIFSYLMPAPTSVGQETRSAIEGFRLYLKTAEKLQLNAAKADFDAPPFMTVERYEKFLPYAIALGVEKPWTSHFERLMPKEAAAYRPHWYGARGNGHHSLHGLNNALVSSMASGVSSAMPQSSGSSGAGGGGFSGGGGGGGGGGGW